MIFHHIVIPLDGSELAENSLSYLETFSLTAETEVELVRAVPPVELHYKAALPVDTRAEKELNQSSRKEAQEYLERVKAKIGPSPAKVTTRTIQGNPADAIVDHLNSSGADLLLMATHGRSGPSRWIWGSTAERILRSTCIPTFIVHPPGCGLKVEG